jgi:hypothetical protein
MGPASAWSRSTISGRKADSAFGRRDPMAMLHNENPRRISPTGARLTINRGYFAQQLELTTQQTPPPQQSAEREVALAVPTSAIAAKIMNRYFIESSC